jgi:hypothetical protein
LTYLTKLNEENLESGFLCILKPAQIVSGWLLLSGSTYYKFFAYHVSGVSANGVDLIEDTGLPATGKFYYNSGTQTVYINHVPSGETIVVTFEMYFATSSKHFYRIPTDSTSRQVFFDGLIIKPPQFISGVSNNFFGFMESQGSVIEIGNPDAEFEPLLYSTSFYNKEIYVYHWIDKLETTNVRLQAKAIMKNINYDRKSVTINILDRVDEFSQEFRGSFYYSSVFTKLDPNFQGRPIRNVFGKVFEAYLVNLDYEANTPTTSTNRKWGVREGSFNTVNQTVGTGSTTVLTYLGSVDGLNSGDSVKFIKGTVEYGLITGVNRVNKTISHTAITTPAVNGNTIERSTAQVYIEKDGVRYRPLYDRDYTEGLEGGLVKITFTSSMESNLSIDVLQYSDKVFADIYGKNNNISTIWTGADSSTYEALTNPVVILYDLIKNYVGDSNIDIATFNTMAATLSTYELGFSLPQNVSSNYPTYKEIITTILTSCLLKFFLNSSNEWTLKQVATLGASTITLENDEILETSLSYDFNGDDTSSEIIVEYKYREASELFETQIAISLSAIYLHGINKQKNFTTYLLTNYVTVTNTLRDLYGDRQGRLKVDVKNRFLNTFVGDTITIGLEKLPGYTFDETTHTRKFDVLEITKSLRSVDLILNDQKGVEEA